MTLSYRNMELPSFALKLDHDKLVALAIISLATLVTSLAAIAIYRVWFHPLSIFPGPRWLAVSNVPERWMSNISGTWIWRVSPLHRKYGPIVRIGPNRLAVDGSIGWFQVYAMRGKDDEFPKYPEYIFPGDGLSILGANQTNHRRHRRQFWSAFNDQALVEQEIVIQPYTDMLLQRLSERAKVGDPINIVDWINFLLFDIAGELVFSQPFDCLDKQEYHPWVSNFFWAVKGNAMNRFVKHYPVIEPFMNFFFTGKEQIKRETDQRNMTFHHAMQRMKLGEQPTPGRRDFMSFLMRRNRDGGGLTDPEILVDCPVLIGASSETTTTALSGFFFYLGTSPQAYQRLVEEVRSSFKSESEINMKTTKQLEYLNATVDEALRVYPPAAESPPRISPGAEIDGKYLPKGVIVSIYQWGTFHNPENFADPDDYIPERWLQPSHPLHNPKYANDNRSVFRPFGFGMRDCLGKNLAHAEIRVVVSRILYRFDYELGPNQEDWHSSQKCFLAWDKKPLILTLKPRDFAP
ncbi:cytochrome p450 3a17 [Fusarium flagelliforme]|uniref:Cytochrome p450 3a17 n=1 Tax=Fusarium flagelliforme TaxID=2675880 RepID=A0A395N577_9HYPO|nr:cytochrome p450 3a17 [Fusarium flagelliforme]